MSSHRRVRVVWVLLCGLVMGSHPAWSLSHNRINDIRLIRQAGGMVVEIAGEQAPNFTTFKQHVPRRVIVDVAECELNGVPSRILGDGKLVESIVTEQYGKSSYGTARVVIRLSREAEYRVTIRGGSLFVHLLPGTGGLLVSAGVPVGPGRHARARGQADQQLATLAGWSLPPSSFEESSLSEMSHHDKALGEELSNVLVKDVSSPPLKMEDDNQSGQKLSAKPTSVKAASSKPVVSQLADPDKPELVARQAATKKSSTSKSRAVEQTGPVDRPAVKETTQLGQADQIVSKPISEHVPKQLVRPEPLAPLDTKTRAEQKSAKLALVASSQGKMARPQAQGHEKLASPPRSGSENLAQQESEEELVPIESAQEEEVGEVEESVEQAPEEAEPPPPPVIEPVPETSSSLATSPQEQESQSLPPPAKPASEVEERLEMSGAVRHMTWVGFQQTRESSRVFVKTNAPVKYQVNEEGQNLVVLELDNTTIPLRNNKRFLDTHFFDSAVAMIVPREVGGVSQNVRIEIQLKHRVPYRAGREENMVYVSFDRPK